MEDGGSCDVILRVEQPVANQQRQTRETFHRRLTGKRLSVCGACCPLIPMTLLGGLFSRKKRREGSVNSTEPESVVSSPTTAGSHHVPSPSRSPPSKLRLTFGRKKTSEVDTRSHPTRTSTDTHSADVRRLRPPPSRSAIFAAYGDPSGALSTRSLPAESASDPPRRPSLFAWGNPSPSSPPSESSTIAAYDSPRNSDAHSFNLKSFRHVRPPSPTNLSSSSLAPPLPRPRPRGASVNSDSSQRISVAAFREAQARRSTAGSPVPDFRSPSPNPPMPPQPRSITPEQGRPRPSRSTPHITQQRQRSSMAVTSTSDSDESTSSSENDSEDDTIQVGKPSIYAKQRAKAKSEIGHHAHSPSKPPDLPPYRAPRSHIGHSPSPQQRLSGHELKNNNVPDVLPVVSSQSVPAVRPRASVSTSALTPTAAAKRASILVASNSKLGEFLSILFIIILSHYYFPRPSHGHSSVAPVEIPNFQSQPCHHSSPHCTIRLGLGRRRTSCHPHGPQETRKCHVFIFQSPFSVNRQRYHPFNNIPPPCP